MANMSYCRFQNTLEDLQDCYNHLWDEAEISEDEENLGGEGLSEDEQRARGELIELCKMIAKEV